MMVLATLTWVAAAIFDPDHMVVNAIIALGQAGITVLYFWLHGWKL
jgi:hypothetical protein